MGGAIRAREATLAERLAATEARVALADLQAKQNDLNVIQKEVVTRAPHWGMDRVKDSAYASPMRFRGKAAATWHPNDYAASTLSRKSPHRFAKNPVETSESLSLSDASWPSFPAVSPARTFSWMSATGTARCFGSISEGAEGLGDSLNSTSGFRGSHRDPMVRGILNDAIDDHVQVFSLDAL